MNREKRLILILLALIISNSCLLISSDFALYKQYKIKDENAQIIGIQKLVLDSLDNMYILCVNRVYKLNNKGEFVGEIIKKGYGPDEIVRSSRINMNESADTLIIHDYEKQKITIFDLDGKYIKTMDSPTKKIGFMLASNNLGDYYLYLGSQKGECQLLHLDKDFKPLNCFFPYNGFVKLIQSDSINIDSDSRGNIYVADNWDYNIHVFTRNGDLINCFASPGENFMRLKGDAPSDMKKYNKWRESASDINSIYVIENKALIVFYREFKGESQIYYDLYSLDGKIVASGVWEKDIRPVGKDRQGHLVCVKEEISADGTDVTYWLYIYSINNNKLKL